MLDSIPSNSSDVCANPSVFITQALLDKGWTQDEIDQINSVIQEVRVGAQIDSNDIDNMKEEVAEDTEMKVTETMLQKKTADENAREAAIRDAYNVYKASNSLSIKEPIVTPVVTRPTNIQDADYSITEDYPDTYGFIDSVKNWFKVNKNKKHAELVMASGTNIKCDKDGNVTFHIKGNFKLVIDGDYTTAVKGNSDTLINGNAHLGIERNLTENICGSHTEVVHVDRTSKITGNESRLITGTTTDNSKGEFSQISDANITQNSKTNITHNSKSTHTIKSGRLNFE